MLKRLLFSGYFGFGNTGDEAIIEALCQEVRRQLPDAEISVLLDNGALAERLNVRAYPRRRPFCVLSALRHCDLLISGGGGLLQDTTGIGSVVYYLGVIVLARLMGRPAYIMCQGFGPVRRQLSGRLVRFFLPWASASSWRDEKSLAEVQGLAPGLEAVLSADPALLLEPLETEATARLKASHNLQRPFILTALRRWPGLNPADYKAALEAVLDTQDDLDLVIVPFQESQDSALAEELQKLLEERRERVHLVKGLLPRQILSLIGEAQMVLAMRLHALIFAASRGVPFLGIAYDPKVANFCERCGMPCLAWDEAKGAELARFSRETWLKRGGMRAELSQRVEPMRTAARGAVSRALDFLKRIPPRKQRD